MSPCHGSATLAPIGCTIPLADMHTARRVYRHIRRRVELDRFRGQRELCGQAELLTVFV